MSNSSPFGLSAGEQHYRLYLLENLKRDLTALNKHNFLRTADFDQLFQHVNFEITNPAEARDGMGPAAAAAGPPKPNASEPSFADYTPNHPTSNTTSSQWSSPHAQPSAVTSYHNTPSSRSSSNHSPQPSQVQLRSDPSGRIGWASSVVGGLGEQPVQRTDSYVLVQVEALADYSGEDADDLPMRAGDVIDVIEAVDAHWYRGRLNGRTGIFPQSFVKPRETSSPGPPLPSR
ncbi:SH3 domain-containing protein [Phlyctochytrium arcticum]|nr:SH3 domain-containing protein [Phlyctochytrium arcticum]